MFSSCRPLPLTPGHAPYSVLRKIPERKSLSVFAVYTERQQDANTDIKAHSGGAGWQVTQSSTASSGQTAGADVADAAAASSASSGTDEGGRDGTSQASKQFAVVNFYHFTEIEDPHGEVERHLAFIEGRDVRSRIYINEQGINAQLSGPLDDVLAYGEWVRADPRFEGMALQVSPSPQGHAFPRLKLRYKPSLVQVTGGTAQLPLTEPAQRALPLTPRQWREKLESAEFVSTAVRSAERPNTEVQPTTSAVNPALTEGGIEFRSAEQSVAAEQLVRGGPTTLTESQEGNQGIGTEVGDSDRIPSAGPGEARASSGEGGPQGGKRKVLLLDVRNGYEWDVGHFQHATRPEVDSFRTTEFGLAESDEAAAQDPLAGVDSESTDVLMYCTGGIRCDVYSTMLRKRGFKNLYTLQGGVARYLKEEGAQHWNGHLFVFDSRLAVPPDYYKAGESLSKGGFPALEDKGSSPLGPSEAGSQSGFARCSSCASQLETVRHRNCANLDCNQLFLVCRDCARESTGCCSPTCQSAPRLRPFLEEAQPYARWHIYRPVPDSRPPGVLTGRALRRRQRRQYMQGDLQDRAQASTSNDEGQLSRPLEAQDVV